MADQQYYSLFTKQGLALLTDAIQHGTKLGITSMAFGDGGGNLPVPNESMTKLVNEVYRTQLNSLAPDPNNANWLRAEAIIASAVGGFNIRELGLYAGDTLVAYSNYPSTYKPNPSDGTARIMTFRMVLQIDNTASFELKIDPDVVLATIQSVSDTKQEIYENTVNTVESITDLLKLTAWDGRTVNIKSMIDPIYTLNNPYSGGGTFKFNKNRSTVNDGGMCINGWERINYSKIYASYFGTHCDGNYDDAIAINRALDYLATNNLLDLYFEQNTYTLKSGFGKRSVSINGDNNNVQYSGQRVKFVIDSSTKVTLFDYESNVNFNNVHLYGITTTNNTVQHDVVPINTTYIGRWFNSRFEKLNYVCGLSTVYHEFDQCHFVANNTAIELFRLKGSLSNNGTLTVGEASTMLQINECQFLYNKYCLRNDASSINRLYGGGEFIDVKISGTGFELSTYGIYAPTAIHLLTFLNCWLEANDQYSLYAPDSRIVDINTRFEGHSPKQVSNDFYSKLDLNGFVHPLMNTNSISAIDQTKPLQLNYSKGINLGSIYSSTSNIATSSGDYGYAYSSEQGSATAGFRFDRESNNGKDFQAFTSIVFFTGAIPWGGGDSKIDRWKLRYDGNLIPLGQYNIGSNDSKVQSSYVVTRKYSETVFDTAGNGSPEGNIAAGIGSTYRQIDGTTGKTFFVKESGTGNTGWIAK